MRLRGGLVAGPLFIAIFLIAGALRAGYDPVRHPVSTLQLGPWGWVQTVNFLLAGLLVTGFASAARSWLVGAVGVGLIGSGVFRTDPVSGYPPGTPPISDYTWHGTWHDLFAIPTFLGWPLACFVLARRFAPVYSVISGVLFLGCFVGASLGFAQTPGFVEIGGLLQRITVTIGFLWLTLLARHLVKTRPLS